MDTRVLFTGVAAVLGVLLLAGCSDGSGGSTGGGGGTGGGSGGGTGGGSEGCGMSFCGCWTEETLMFAATVLNGQTGDPVAGIELYCDKETAPIAVSDAMGKVTFSIETLTSPGCGPERCKSVTFHDPTGPLADTTGTYYEHNGKDVVLTYKPD